MLHIGYLDEHVNQCALVSITYNCHCCMISTIGNFFSVCNYFVNKMNT